MIFQSRFETIALAPEVPQQIIAEERNLYQASRETALRLGGPATKSFVELLPQSWRDDPHLTIRSKLARLRKGWYPCINCSAGIPIWFPVVPMGVAPIIRIAINVFANWKRSFASLAMSH